jgi:amino acid transporter
MTTAVMTTAVLAAADAAGGFSWKTLLTFVGAAILLAFFSSLGIIARLRDRRMEERKEARLAQERQQRAEPDQAGPAGPANG